MPADVVVDMDEREQRSGNLEVDCTEPSSWEEGTGTKRGQAQMAEAGGVGKTSPCRGGVRSVMAVSSEAERD